jgi:hypothetical protein
MLIRLILSPADEHRSGANQMRQHLSFREHFRRGNAAFAFLVLGGNTFGLLAPILTGYIVAATGSFDSAFIVAGALAFVGAVAALVLARGTRGEHVRPHLARPGLACAAIAGPV